MDDSSYKEALHRYQVDMGLYKDAVHLYKVRLQNLQEGDSRPTRPIPPVPPIRAVKFNFSDPEEPASTENIKAFNEGIEAAAQSLQEIGENDLADWVRRHRRDST